MKTLDEELIGKALSYSESAMVKGMINRTLIVEWGTVKNIVTKGVVDVLLSVTEKPENTTVVTCVLISPCSASFSIDIEPQVGDKVLVLSPRHFDVDMFDVTEDTEVIEKPNFAGYNKLACMAILYNQFRPDTHKNSIAINGNGVIQISTAYNEDDEEDKLIISTDEDGAINIDSNGNTISLDKDGAVDIELAYDKDNDIHKLSITTDKNGAYNVKNEKSTVSVNADGYLSYANTDDGKSKVEFTSSGFTIQDKNECKIVSSSSDIQINGKLKVKK